MYISSDKQAKSHVRKPGHKLRKENLKREIEYLLIAAQNKEQLYEGEN